MMMFLFNVMLYYISYYIISLYFIVLYGISSTELTIFVIIVLIWWCFSFMLCSTTSHIILHFSTASFCMVFLSSNIFDMIILIINIIHLIWFDFMWFDEVFFWFTFVIDDIMYHSMMICVSVCVIWHTCIIFECLL